MKKVSVVVPSFRGAWRVERLLESIQMHDVEVLTRITLTIVEDPSDAEATKQYERVVRANPGVRYFKLKNWSNMHGAAMQAFTLVRWTDDSDWIVYLGDDVLVTPGALSNLVYFLQENELETVGLVQIPYWNAHDLTVGGYDGQGNRDWHPHGPETEHRGDRFVLLKSKEEMYTRDPAWLSTVPQNPHWNGAGYSRPYVNVNGVGFACRRTHYFEVGGFAEGTWCLDESISVRTWTRSKLSIVTLPGQPFIHYFGGATESEPPAHDLHTEARWIEAMGLTKHEAGVISYAAMAARESSCLEEMRAARYYSTHAISR
jgi:glycosyltransferase involved in cell wall biosynthesis